MILKPELLLNAVKEYQRRAGAAPACILLSISQFYQLAVTSTHPNDIKIEFRNEVPFFMGIPMAVHGPTCDVTPAVYTEDQEVISCELCTHVWPGNTDKCPNCGHPVDWEEEES